METPENAPTEIALTRREVRLARIALAAAIFSMKVRSCQHPRLSRQLMLGEFLPRCGGRRALGLIRKRQESMMSAAGIGNRAYRRNAVKNIRFA